MWLRIALGLACSLAAAAAGLNDHACLLQSQRDLALDVAPRSAADPAPPESALGLLEAIRQAARDLKEKIDAGRSEGPGENPALPYMMELLTSLKNATFLQKMTAGVNESMTGLASISAFLREQSDELAQSAETNRTKAEALHELEVVLEGVVKETVEAGANVTLGLRDLLLLMPPGSKILDIAAPALNIFVNMTKRKMIRMLYDELAVPLVQDLMKNRTRYCSYFSQYEGFVSRSVDNLADLVLPLLDSANSTVEKFSVPLMALAGDVGPQVMSLVHMAMGGSREAVLDFQESLPQLVDAIRKVSTEKAECVLPKDKSGARGAPTVSLGVLVAAAAAWLTAW